MSFFDSMNIVGSALTAERLRMDVSLQNIANANTTRTKTGEPYRRKQVVFQERTMSFKDVLSTEQYRMQGGGVRVTRVVESDRDFVPVYRPQPSGCQRGRLCYDAQCGHHRRADRSDGGLQCV